MIFSLIVEIRARRLFKREKPTSLWPWWASSAFADEYRTRIRQAMDLARTLSCGRCGKPIYPEDVGRINGTPYCHSTTGPMPTCYMMARWNLNRSGMAPRRVRSSTRRPATPTEIALDRRRNAPDLGSATEPPGVRRRTSPTTEIARHPTSTIRDHRLGAATEQPIEQRVARVRRHK